MPSHSKYTLFHEASTVRNSKACEMFVRTLSRRCIIWFVTYVGGGQFKDKAMAEGIEPPFLQIIDSQIARQGETGVTWGSFSNSTGYYWTLQHEGLLSF